MIPSVLNALEQVQPATNWMVAKLVPWHEPSNVGKYLSRAVGLGLATVDRSYARAIFACVPGWRELVAERGGVVPDLPEAARPVLAKPVPVRRTCQVPGFGVALAPRTMPTAAELHPLYTVWR